MFSLSKIKQGMNYVAAALVAAVFAITPEYASAQVTLPDVGVDTGAYVTALGTALGAVIAVVVGVYFAFMLIKIALRWSRKATG